MLLNNQKQKKQKTKKQKKTRGVEAKRLDYDIIIGEFEL